MDKDLIDDLVPDIRDEWLDSFEEQAEDDLRFLKEVGSSVQRKLHQSGYLHKCPLCGELADSFDVVSGTQLVQECDRCKKKFIIKANKKRNEVELND